MSVKYDDKNKAYICDKHGYVGRRVGWVECNSCGGGGGRGANGYDEDDLGDDPLGDSWDRCFECAGAGGWLVCGKCHADDPEVTW